MTAKLSGGCACGSIRYECSEEPMAQLICHCRDCQRASGSGYAAVLVVPSDRFKFTAGEPKYHAVEAESGKVMRRGFCVQCGSPISIRKPEAPLIEYLQAASLDDPSKFTPSYEVWTSSALPWDQLHPTTRKFERSPTEDVRASIGAYFARREKLEKERL